MADIRCMICGEIATQFFASNTNLPLCALSSCEAALIDEINGKINEAAQSSEGEQ